MERIDEEKYKEVSDEIALLLKEAHSAITKAEALSEEEENEKF